MSTAPYTSRENTTFKQVDCDELSTLTESYQCEAKAAKGENSEGKIPRNVWESYSSFANTQGGKIVLGAKELSDGTLQPVGLQSVAGIEKDFWNTINNESKVNRNILRNEHVQHLVCEGAHLLIVHVPSAGRRDRPIYINGDPMRGTFQRYNDGDHLFSEATVRRMFAEASDDTRDSDILEHYTLNDINQESLNAYRQEFRTQRPGDGRITEDDLKFLTSIGAWKRDRQTNHEGLTIAGLLFFGKHLSLKEKFPHFQLDYQERNLDPEQRWLDRVVNDGGWSGNLYDFFRRIYGKLTADLKVPFSLKGSQRVDQTNIHDALREALVNALVHADHSSTTGILIYKYPHKYVFTNPGRLRLPKIIILNEQGGQSDQRNPLLFQLFYLIGAAEQAGTGLPKILRAWRAQDWRVPTLSEDAKPEQVRLELTMQSLVPQEVTEILEEAFGDRYTALDQHQRLALTTAISEGEVSNKRLQEISNQHPADITKTLRYLKTEGFLFSSGVSSGTTYYVLGVQHDQPNLFPQNQQVNQQAEDQNQQVNQQAGDQNQQAGDYTHPSIQAVQKSKSISKDQLEKAIVESVRNKFLSIREIASVLNRRPQTIRGYMSDLVSRKQLIMRYPDSPSHSAQAYRATGKTE